jgi:hypothetical protein
VTRRPRGGRDEQGGHNRGTPGRHGLHLTAAGRLLAEGGTGEVDVEKVVSDAGASDDD